MDLYEEKPNDDYESSAMRQRVQPHAWRPTNDNPSDNESPSRLWRTSWFACEDALDDWRDKTKLESEKWGPDPMNRLEEEASVFKKIVW